MGPRRDHHSVIVAERRVQTSIQVQGAANTVRGVLDSSKGWQLVAGNGETFPPHPQMGTLLGKFVEFNYTRRVSPCVNKQLNE
jgi:hypothetical protein